VSENPNDHVEKDPSGVTRRSVLRKGAIVGGAAFMVPAVQSISMSRASAQSPSGGPPAAGTPGDHHHHHHFPDW
jgi:hypothetical protein